MDFRQYALSTLLAGACLMPSAVWAECDDSGLPDGVTLVETNTPTGPQCLEVYYDDPPVVQFQASVTTCDLTGIEPGNEVVELMTPMGMICVELFHREAPLHVEDRSRAARATECPSSGSSVPEVVRLRHLLDAHEVVHGPVAPERPLYVLGHTPHNKS